MLPFFRPTNSALGMSKAQTGPYIGNRVLASSTLESLDIHDPLNDVWTVAAPDTSDNALTQNSTPDTPDETSPDH